MPRIRLSSPVLRPVAFLAGLVLVTGVMSFGSVSTASAVPVKHSHRTTSSRSSRKQDDVTVAPDEVSAGVDAKAQGHRVEALSLRSETSQTFVNPDGTETVESTMLPARVKDAAAKDGWRDIDLDLKVNADGSISPKSPLYDLTLNGGGASQASKPLLTLADGSSKSLSLGWKRGGLSQPVIDGDTVTYKNVRPNEDLVITATRTGFEQSLVLNAKPQIAADANIQMPVTAHGLKLKNVAGGQFAITDLAGHMVGGAGPPQLADATTGTTDPSPAAQAVADMTVDTSGAQPEIDVTPSGADLNDAVYPLTIDPTVSMVPGADTYVASGSPNSYFNTSVYLRSGDSTDGNIYRSYMKWAGTGIAGATVTAAQMSLYENSSGTGSGCTTSNFYLYAANNSMQIAAMTWNNQPTNNTAYSASAGTNYGGGTSCSPATFSMDVTSLMQHFASEGDSDFTMEIYSSETSHNGYKQFGSADSSHQPVLTVTYAHAASFPSGFYIVGQNQVGGNWYIPSTSPTIYASASNQDGDPVHLTAEFFTTSTSTTAVSACTFTVASGAGGSCVASPALADGVSYWYHVGANVNNYPQTSWGGRAQVTVSAGAAPAPTSISCPVPNNQWTSPKPAGQTITCQVHAPSASPSADSADLFNVNIDGANTVVPAGTIDGSGSTGSFTFANADGAHAITAQAVSFGGHASASTISYHFGLGQVAMNPVANGGRVASEHITLSATAPSAYVDTSTAGAKLEWSLDGQNWTPSSTLPTIAVSGGIETASFDWPAPEAISGSIGSGDDAVIWTKVVFTAVTNPVGVASFTTPPTTLMRIAHPFGSQYPTASAGSGQVSLYTGEFTTTSDDVSAPSLGGALSLSRTFDSHNPTRTGPSNVFGPGWSASLSGGADGYAEAAVDYQSSAGTLFIDDPILSTDLTFVAGALGSLNAAAGVTLTPADTTTSQSDVVVKAVNSGPGTPITLTATELNGTVTTWKAASPYTSWVLSTVIVPSEGTTTTYYADGSGRIDAVVTHSTAMTSCQGSLASLAGQSAPITTAQIVSNLSAGCTGMSLVYGPAVAQASVNPGASGYDDEPGLLQSVSSVAYDPSTSAMASVPLAQYAYDSTGRLSWFDNLTKGLGATGQVGQVTTYTYTTGTIGSATQQLLTSEHPAGFAPIDYTYSTTGTAPEGDTDPLVSVDRGNADGSAGTTRQTTVVYGLPTTASPLQMSGAPSPQWWGQNVTGRPITYSTAVFGADYTPPAGGIAETDVRHAAVYYMDPTGFETNTAVYGAGGWQYTDAEYLTDGTPSYTLTAKDTADAIAWHNAGNVTAFNYAARETITRYYLTDPVGGAPVPQNTLVEDTWSPEELVTKSDGSAVEERQHTHYDYDADAPASNVNPSTNEPYELPTMVTVGETTVTNVSTDPSVTLAADLSQLSKTTYQYAPLDASISGTDVTSGWSLGKPTVTDQVAGTGESDIVTKSVFAANGTELKHEAPGSTGTDAATTVTHLYDDATDASAPTTCQSHPQWAGLACQSGPAAQPASGQPLPVSTVAGYNFWLEPTQTVQTSGTATRTSTSTYLPYGQPDTQAVTTSGLTGSTPVPTTKDIYDPTTFVQTAVESLDASGNATGTDSQTFDQWGRNTSYTNSLGETTTTSYVPAGTAGAGQVAQVASPKTTTTYSYDGTDANGKVEHRGLLTGLTVSGVGSYSAGYDADGNLTSQKLPDGVVENIGYDVEGNDRPTSLTYTGQVVSGGTTTTGTWLSYSRNYNAAGQVFQEITPQATSSAPGGYSKQYVYDEADRLVQVDDATDPTTGSASCTVRQYAFDGNGNRTSLTSIASATACSTTGTSTTKTWSYDVANRQTTGANGVGSYVYDPFGRQTTMPASDAPNSAAGNITIGYYDTDAVRSVSQNGAVTTYGLDPDGRRVTSSTSAATVTNHYTDGSDNPDWATQVGGSTTQTSIYTGDITGVLGATTIVSGSSAAVSLDLADMGGNTVATVPLPASGNATSVTGYASYDEYGNPETGAISTGADSYGWLGTKQRASDSTGLVLMGARLYDSTTGRFTSVDPKVGGNANAYNYPDDPLDETDLSGDMAAWALAAEGWIGSAEAVNVADDWNPVGWGTAAALGAAAVTILAVDAVQNAKGSGVMAAHKKKAPQSSANANPHRTTKNGKSGSDKHTKRDGHGGQRHLPPNPNKRAR